MRTRAYVASLPQGLASYPGCVSKASIWRNILRNTNTRGFDDRLPPELATAVQGGPLDAAWFPTVHNFAGHLALRDCCFVSDDAMSEHFRVLDRGLLSGPLYRVLFAVVSPQRVVEGADRRFAAMFKGIELHTLRSGPRGAHLRLTCPLGILPPLVARLYLVAFEVALELAGADGIHGKVSELTSGSADFELSWR